MTELSPSASAELSTTRAWLLALLMATFVFVGIAPTLTWPEFTGGNENIVVQTALEMRHGGPWLVPNMMGEPRVKKPPLVAWITALSMRPATVAGLEDPQGRNAAYHALAWQVRWTGLLAGCVMMLATFELGRVIGGTTTGLCAAAAVATNLLFLKYMRQSTSDVHLAMWTTIANAAFVHGLLRKRWWLAATLGAFATGMAFLCKGPVALLETVLPLTILLPFRARLLTPLTGERLGEGISGKTPAERETARQGLSASASPHLTSPQGEGQEASPLTWVLRFLLGLLIFAAVALPWFLHVYLVVPNVWHTWFTEVSRQGATDLKPDSPLTYLQLIPSLWPWIVFGFIGLLACRDDRRLRIALVQIVLPLLVMTLFKDRKERYLLPMIAPAAVLCGGGAALWWRELRSPATWPRAVLIVHAIVLFGGAIAFVIIGTQQKTLAGGRWFSPTLATWSLVALASLAGLWWIAQRRRRSAVIGFTMIVMLGLGGLFMFGYSQTANAISPFKPMANQIRQLGDVPVHDWIDPDDADKRVDEGFPIYLNRTVTRADPATLTGPAVVILKQQNDSKPTPTLPPPWRPMATAREKRILWWAFER